MNLRSRNQQHLHTQASTRLAPRIQPPTTVISFYARDLKVHKKNVVFFDVANRRVGPRLAAFCHFRGGRSRH